MKLLRMIVIAALVMMLGSSALAGTPGEHEMENLAIAIQSRMETGKYMSSDMEVMYLFQGFTTAQICEAITTAVGRLDEDTFASDECIQTYLDYVADNSDPYVHGALIRDLGDESVPLYALCAVAAAALAGAAAANRKRARA